MPIIVVVLTAILGTGVGIWLQNRSFRKNELFKAKLSRILKSQEEAVEITHQVDEARRQIRSNEDFIREQISQQQTATEQNKARQYYIDKNPMLPSIAILKESMLRLNALGNYAGTLSANNPVSGSVKNFTANLNDFLGCLEADQGFKESCSDRHPDLLDSLQSVTIAYSKMADNLIDEYD